MGSRYIVRTLRQFQGMNEGDKYVLWQREEIPCPLNSVMKTSELFCQGYIGYWCYPINTQTQEKEAEDIPVICEFRDVFLKSYWDQCYKYRTVPPSIGRSVPYPSRNSTSYCSVLCQSNTCQYRSLLSNTERYRYFRTNTVRCTKILNFLHFNFKFF